MYLITICFDSANSHSIHSSLTLTHFIYSVHYVKSINVSEYWIESMWTLKTKCCIFFIRIDFWFANDQFQSFFQNWPDECIQYSYLYQCIQIKIKNRTFVFQLKFLEKSSNSSIHFSFSYYGNIFIVFHLIFISINILVFILQPCMLFVFIFHLLLSIRMKCILRTVQKEISFCRILSVNVITIFKNTL